MAKHLKSHRKMRRRSGVVLLVVLSLLVLLVIVGMMFAVAAGQYQRSARIMAQSDLATDDPMSLLDSAMYQVVRDTETNRSVFRGHSLLRDMYGDDWLSGEISRAQYAGASQSNPLGGTAGQLIDLTITVPSSATLSDLLDFYAGRVITITSDTTGVVSTRVVGYVPPPTGPTLRVLSFLDKHGDPLQLQNGLLVDLALAKFRMNGRPFNGTGFAYDQATGKLTPEALYPNRATASSPFVAYLEGGSDESYDAADFQNMALAAVIPASDAPGAVADVIPTGHRPSLINYHRANNSSAWDPTNPSFNDQSSKDERRRVILRPMPSDHPNFTGSNPEMAVNMVSGAIGDILDQLEDGPWDVDNDADGTRDSVWLDLGFPVQRSRDGRAYKPLFAILCLDLDGRLNVNAHGNAGHYQDPTPVDVAPRKLNTPNPLTKSDTLGRRGQGYGPPEVNLRRLFDPNSVAADYRALVQGRYRSSISGNPDSLPGQTGLEVKSAYKFFEFPDNYFTSPTRSSYFSPPDLWGQLAFGLDYRGQPIFESPAVSNVPNAKADSPYELALVDEGVDVQFSIAELERLLRVYDIDAARLPARLQSLLTDLTNTNGQRRVTTHSFEVPVPNISLPPDLQSLFTSTRPENVTVLFRARMQGNTLSPAVAEALVAPELLRGERFDLNRPFGNGMDDNGNFVVDEHGHDANFESVLEAAGTEQWFPSTPTNPTFLNNPPLSTATIDHDNDGVFANDTDAFLARYYYARHLYMLMMVLADNDTAGQKSPALARRIAQWAVNVVDFRDPDSIMTAFEYDQNPFNGWDVNGILNASDVDQNHPDRAVVWGCERPELLITEALAFHDKRTRNVPNIPSTNEQQDPHLDQGEPPQGSTFIELYNPWAGVNEMRPAEFYWNNGFANGVLLNKRAPDSSPVWRIIVIKDPQSKGQDPNDPDSGFQTADIERRIYFVDPTGAPIPGDYYTSLPVAPITPGGYAVIGSPGQPNTNNTAFTTVISRRRDADPDARRIVLRPGANPNPTAVEVRGNIRDAIGVIPPEPGVADLPPAVAVVIDTPALNVSEPVNGYNLPPLSDEPFDLSNPELDDPTGLDEKTLPDFCEFQLQRLANPLLPQDDVTNPYVTIDSVTTDLTLYNGVSDDQPPMAPQAQPNPQEVVRFYSRQRGDRDATYPPDPNQAWQPFATYPRLLWPYEPAQPLPQPPSNSQQESPPSGHLGHYFEYTLKHSLGYLNHNYWPYYDVASRPTPLYTGAPNSDIAANGNDMGPPFPWLPWNNRPYVSHLELLQVPRSSAFNLLRDFTTAQTNSPYSPGNSAPFGHMLNFFESSSTPQAAANLYRLFDYVHVPSRFVGTQITFDPTVFRPVATGTERLHPPFCQVSTFRDPGRVNVNTIYSANVWGAIMDGHGGPSWSELVASRRGYAPTGPATNPITMRDSSVPTVFANPFRAAGAGELVPLTSMERVGSECTLLRSDAVNQASSPTNDPLFRTKLIGTFADDSSHANRNPYFHLEGLQRLGNILSTRSNVYAVWITVGFFEVEPVQNLNTKYPYDGYLLAREVGELTGEIKRHRAFYVIDRSIPVAFSPGENLNVDHAILLRRFIE